MVVERDIEEGVKAGEEELGTAWHGETPRYTPDEVRVALEALGDNDMVRLRAYARYLAGSGGIDVDDLMSEAFRRVLTTRSCSADVDMVRFVAGVMKSIRSDVYRAGNGSGAGVVVPSAANDREEAAADLSPEQEAIDRPYYRACLERVSAAIADDEELQFLVEGLGDDLRGEELEKLLNTDTKGLAAARKRLSRRLAKAFPDGTPL